MIEAFLWVPSERQRSWSVRSSRTRQPQPHGHRDHHAVLDPAHGRTGALTEAFAAGALVAMVADTMLPESCKVEGVFTGSFVAAGFAVSLMLAAL